MKKLIVLLTFLTVLLAPAVFAADGINIVNSTATSSGIKQSSISGFFIVNNTGDGPLNVTFSGLDLTKGSDGLTVSLSPTSISNLAANASQTVTYSVTPAINQSVGTYSGTVTATGGTASDTMTLNIGVEQKAALEVTAPDLRITYVAPFDEFKSSDDSVDAVGEGSRADVDIYPGSEIEFIIEVENTFSDASEVDIDDITVLVTIEELDDGSDIEEETSEFDLETGEEETVRLTLTVPEIVEAKEYDVIIEVEGEDTNGDTQSVIRNLSIDVIKDSHDINVVVATISPDKASCGDIIKISSIIRNQGNQEENDAALKITNADLGLKYEREDIELEQDPFDSDSEFESSFSFEVPNDARDGEYDVNFRAFFRNSIEIDSRVETLTISGCRAQTTTAPVVSQPAQEEEEKEEETVEEEQQPTQTASQPAENENVPSGTVVPIVSPTESVEKPVTSSPLFVGAIVLLNIVLIGLVIVIVKLVLAKK